MKTRMLIAMLALCVFSASCGDNKKQSKPSIAKIAHEHDCMTMDEFCELNYSYVYETKLPCLVCLEDFFVGDIVSRTDDSREQVNRNSDEDDGTDIYIPSWIGVPSTRNNICWMEGWMSNQYIGLDETQTNLVLSKANKSRKIDVPIIIKIYQIDIGSVPIVSKSLISYKADLVAILNE